MTSLPDTAFTATGRFERGNRSPSSLRDSLHRSRASTGSLLGTGGVQRRLAPPGEDSITSRQLYQAPFVQAYKQVAKQQNLRKLAELFAEADEDNSQSMSLTEFRQALHKPWIQKTFSTLGVQPHQSELVFKSMANSEEHELSFEEFLTGLQGVVGTDVDGTGTEIDISTLRPTRAAKLQRETMRGSAVAESRELMNTSMGVLRCQAPSLSEERLHRAFIDSAQAKALLPPPTAKQTIHRTKRKVHK